MFKNFEELIERVKKNNTTKKLVLVGAHDLHSLEAIFRAVDEKIVTPILIGDKKKIDLLLEKLDRNKYKAEVIDEANDEEMSKKAVELVHLKKADFIMKGKIQTKDLLKSVVDKDKGLRNKGAIMSHITINEVPSYHKLLAITDGGMVTYPDVAKKQGIIKNAVEIFNSLGYEKPKVAVLAAVEKVNPKMEETVDANKLKELSIDGKLGSCILEGPISYDLSISQKTAEIKEYKSEVAGDADILVVPNITAGNILGKSLIFSANARMAGFVVGAKVPIVLTSRGASSEEKFLSIVLSVAI